MSMQYDISYGQQCPKYPEIKKTSKRLCEACVYNYQAYHTFAWCSDVKRTPREDLIDNKDWTEREYRNCMIKIKNLLEINPDLVNIKID